MLRNLYIVKAAAVGADPHLAEQRAGPRLVSAHDEGERRAAAGCSDQQHEQRQRPGRGVPLSSRRPPLNSGCSTCSSGRPATGRMWMRGPAMSVSDGATTRSTPEPSSSQDSRRRSAWLRSDHAPTATVSAPVCSQRLDDRAWTCRRPGRPRPSGPGVRSMQAPTTEKPAYGSRRSWRTSSAQERSRPTTTTRCRQRPAARRGAGLPRGVAQQQRQRDRRAGRATSTYVRASSTLRPSAARAAVARAAARRRRRPAGTPRCRCRGSAARTSGWRRSRAATAAGRARVRARRSAGAATAGAEPRRAAARRRPRWSRPAASRPSSRSGPAGAASGGVRAGRTGRRPGRPAARPGTVRAAASGRSRPSAGPPPSAGCCAPRARGRWSGVRSAFGAGASWAQRPRRSAVVRPARPKCHRATVRHLVSATSGSPGRNRPFRGIPRASASSPVPRPAEGCRGSPAATRGVPAMGLVLDEAVPLGDRWTG